MKKELKRIKKAYSRTPLDYVEVFYKSLRELILGVDLSIFEKTIQYWKESRGKTISKKEALQIALNKKEHKDAWFKKKRESIEDIMEFYKEVEIYPFRQPYTKRYGGYRWLMKLVKHIPNPSVLEYGCGSAILTEWLIENFPKATYAVADIPSTTLEFIKWKKNKYNYPYEILTIGKGKQGIPLAKKYDLIICKDVLEHTPNPFEIVESFTEHLSPMGVLAIDFIDDCEGENLPMAGSQRESVKKILSERLIPLKAIDELGKNDGLYVKA